MSARALTRLDSSAPVQQEPCHDEILRVPMVKWALSLFRDGIRGAMGTKRQGQPLGREEGIRQANPNDPDLTKFRTSQRKGEAEFRAGGLLFQPDFSIDADREDRIGDLVEDAIPAGDVRLFFHHRIVDAGAVFATRLADARRQLRPSPNGRRTGAMPSAEACGHHPPFGMRNRDRLAGQVAFLLARK